MVNVFARAEMKPGCQEKYLDLLRANIPTVRAEAGCIRYEACLDTDPATRGSFVTIVESWESEAALKAHLATPHMAAFRKAAGELRCSNVVCAVEPIA